MTETTLRSVVVVLAVCVLAPLLADAVRNRVRLPTVVLELALGIAIGPSLLGWVADDEALSGLSDLGLALLMFLAGYEIEFHRIRGAPLVLAVRAWLASLLIGCALAVLVGLVAGSVDLRTAALGLVVTTTAVGTLLPILRDRGDLPTRFGAFALAGGAVGEFGPLVGVSLLLASSHPGRSALVMAVFLAVAAGAVVLALRARTPRIVRIIGETLSTSAQFGVRTAMLLCVLLVWVATAFDLDFLLGAFAGGIILRQFLSASPHNEVHAVEAKLEGIGFGFLVPIFFVMSGVRLDLDALFAQPLYLLLVPVAMAAFLVVRGAPVLLLARPHRSHLGGQDVRALALYSATALPLVVVITGTAVEDGVMSPALASVLVTAAVLSVVAFPMAAGALRGAPAPVSEPSDSP